MQTQGSSLALCRHFKDLPGPTRIQLARCLGTKAAELASTLKSMGRDVAPDPDTQLRIRNVIAQSVFFLSWALRTCVETQKAEEQEAGGAHAQSVCTHFKTPQPHPPALAAEQDSQANRA